MSRRLTAVAGTLLLMVGLGLASAGLGLTSNASTGSPAAAAAQAAVVPHHGSYAGVDHHGRIVTFSFSGNQMTHFSVGHLVIGGAHVSQGMWHETCHNGVCTKGSWTNDGHVTGAWRHAGQYWTSFTASTAPPALPYTGTYMGSDHSGLKIHFAYDHGHLRGFKVDHNLVGDAAVSHGKFEVCHQSMCFKGHWETDFYVVGTWRYTNSHHWRPWEGYAYAT